MKLCKETPIETERLAQDHCNSQGAIALLANRIFEREYKLSGSEKDSLFRCMCSR
jgi:hypothetical protein